MKNALQTFEPNLVGRDFVIGDLHGALPAFEILLERLYFDESKDRMFSVGDLVDRGPDSLGCLRLLRQPWFHAVLSNHEQMMLEAFRGGYMGNFWVQNGGFWGNSAWNVWKNREARKRDPMVAMTHATDEDLEIIDLIELVEELPYLITVNVTDDKKFHILHAELPPGETAVTDEVLAQEPRVRKLAMQSGGDGDAFLWSRFLFMNFYRADLGNEDKVKRAVAYKFLKDTGPFNEHLSHIISGHTILTRPLTLIGQTNIDTCAYGSCREDASRFDALTCIELKTWKFFQATPTSFKEVQPLEVNRSDLEALRIAIGAVNKANHMGQ